MQAVEQLAANKCFGGTQLRLKHKSKALDCDMTFGLFLPANVKAPVPVLYWLSGLTCNDENFVAKAGAQRYAQQYGLAIVAPDTSPRGEGVPDDPEGAWDFGLGAGFYVNAERDPWSRHYRMYDYVVEELPALVGSQFPVDTARASVFGHSMGGMGALVTALRNPDRYRSVSAFAPVCSPMNCPWGEKALGNYLGADRDRWYDYDPCELVRRAREHLPVMVDQGGADHFLEQQLNIELLMAAAREVDYPMDIRLQAAYDHSYFFIATFIGDHIRFHSNHL